jgi:predicted metal-dependent hydrolase
MERSSRDAPPSGYDGDFAHAVELFNAGRYFESHEVWEGLWLRADGAEKLFLQGLIQAAAAMLHLERGNLPGARSLQRKAQARLEAVPAEFMDLAVSEFRHALTNFMLAALDGSRTAAPPQLRHFKSF